MEPIEVRTLILITMDISLTLAVTIITTIHLVVEEEGQLQA